MRRADTRRLAPASNGDKGARALTRPSWRMLDDWRMTSYQGQLGDMPRLRQAMWDGANALICGLVHEGMTIMRMLKTFKD